MAEKDMTEKTLEAYNDVFADIVNGLLFDGRVVVAEDDLTEATARSIYKTDGKLHEQERDVAKYWKNGTIRIAFYGFENQTESDGDMPLRLFGYDGAAYRAQLLTDKESIKKTGYTAPRYPVVTLVLYFGFKKHWDKPLTLLECLEIPDEIRPFVNDYKINLQEIAYLTDEQVNNFYSDFRIVADYFVQMRKGGDYKAPDAVIRHVHEFLQLMAAMTGDHRYEEIYSPDMERSECKVCEVLDRIEKRGIQQGIDRGEENMRTLMRYLITRDRIDDLKRLSEDSSYAKALMSEVFSEKTV